MRRATPLTAVLLVLAGCGDGTPSDTTTARTRAAAPATTQAAPPARSQLLPPAGVPERSSRRAPRADAAVVRRWSAALRHGDVVRAAAYFAQPSRVQNGTPVIVLHTATERRVFNASLPCGAVPVRYRAAAGYTIVRFRLVERVGGDCRGATGNFASCAIRVRNGRITDWYRLPDAGGRSPVPSGDAGQPGQAA